MSLFQGVEGRVLAGAGTSALSRREAERRECIGRLASHGGPVVPSAAALRLLRDGGGGRRAPRVRLIGAWWTRQQRLRVLAALLVQVELRVEPKIPLYQRIAAEAAEMRARGVSMRAVAEHFGVDDHTVAKAVRWSGAIGWWGGRRPSS